MNGYKAWIVFWIIAVSTFLYGGCSSFDSTEAPETTENLTQPTEITSEQVKINPAKARSESLVIGVNEIPTEIHPFFPKSTVDQWVIEGIFEGLIEPDHDGKPIARLAESYEISEDGLEYTFNLRGQVSFHDGTTVTAEDYLFTYETLTNEAYNGAYKETFEAIDKFEILDGTKFKVSFNESSIYHIWAFTLPVVPKHIYDFEDWASFEGMTSPLIGTGPLMWNGFEFNKKIELIGNAFYYLENDGVGKVVFENVQGMDLSTELIRGAVDMTLADHQLKSKISGLKESYLTVVSLPTNEYTYIGLDHTNPILSDKRTRQALAYGFNRTQSIADSWNGEAEFLDGPVLEHHWTYPEDQALNDYQYDMEKAKTLLTSAGWSYDSEKNSWTNGEVKLSVPIYTFSEVDWAYKLALQLESDWKQLGVETDIHWMDFDALNRQVFQEKAAPAWIMAWQLPVDYDPSLLFGSDSALNAGHYKDDVANALFEQMRTAEDSELRINLVSEWVSLANDQLPYLFVANPKQAWIVNKRVENLEFSPYKSWIRQIAQIKVEGLE